MKTGTLQELNVQPGDVVQWRDCDAVTVSGWDLDRCYNTNQKFGGSISMDTSAQDWRLISRASDTPKLWHDMTPEEKGALLLAAHEGRTVQLWHVRGGWVDSVEFGAVDFIAYRVKPDDVRETVTLFWKRSDTGYNHEIGTIDLINGEPDPASIRMDRL